MHTEASPSAWVKFSVVNRIVSVGVPCSAFKMVRCFRMMENEFEFLSEQAQLGRTAQTWFSQTFGVLEVEKSMSRGTCQFPGT